ncbi:MAG: T9SS type A sorting domain-containing protein [Ignavibacteriaceae bacterium]|nr:T9SS type A sorting domain-containing protein [Ignavibacteriaceae bacterium]
MKQAVLALFFIYCGSLYAQTAVAPSGSGTQVDPYLISTWQNLYWISQNSSSWNKYFRQTADIDFADASPAINTWDGNKGWLPIGGSSSPYFSGVYDGGDYTITGLYIYRTGTGNNALFSVISGAACTVKNAGLIDVNITGAGQNGGIAGSNSATITDCYVTGSVNVYGSNARTGGLVGTNNGTITRCFSTAAISGYSETGGLAGYTNSGSTISYSFASCAISISSNYGGGLAGQNAGTLSNVYANGTLTNSTGASYYGGVAGTNSGTIQYAYAAVTISATIGQYVQAFVGNSSNNTSNCYWDTEVDGITGNTSANFNALPKTTAAMTTQSTFSGWDFSTVWAMSSVVSFKGYPSLQWTKSHSVEPVSNQVADLTNLVWIAENSSRWTSSYTQTADIDAQITRSWDDRKGWSPIGNNITHFSGDYNGGNFSINGLYANNNSKFNFGFIGYNSSSSLIENVHLENVYIKGDSYTGGVCGFSSGSIENCIVSGKIIGYEGVGGIAGLNFMNTISDCFSSAIISGVSRIGGLTGWNESGGTINRSASTGNVSSTGGEAGGFAGRNNGIIANSYTRGNVVSSGSYGYGGFVGTHQQNSITKCYSTGSVQGNGTTIGGFTGASYATLNTSFFNAETDGIEATVSGTDNFGATGKSTAEMKTNATFLDAGWDMNIWYRDDNFNDGYPYLAWQNSGGTPLPVELISFTARVNGKTVTLQWKTATEVNNYGFDIERFGPFERPVDVEAMHPDCIGTNASSLRVIGFVPGHGNSNSEKSYIYTDNSPADGYYYYRLKQIDTDGQFEHSGIVEVSVLTIPQELTLYQNYPNPFNAGTRISFALPHHLAGERVTLSVYDVTGSLTDRLYDRAAEPGRHDIYWNGAERASGIYILRLQGGGEMRVLRVILLK